MNAKAGITVIVVVLIGVVLFVLGDFGGSDEPSPFDTAGTGEAQDLDRVVVGEEVPDFVLTDFKGQEVRLSDFRGKPVMIDFWAKWCPFCIGEMPEINNVFNEFDGELVVLGIHRTRTEPLTTGQDFAEGLGIDYLLLSDVTDEVYKTYDIGVGSMPVAAYIDPNGILVSKKAGPKTPGEIREAVDAILAAQAEAETTDEL